MKKSKEWMKPITISIDKNTDMLISDFAEEHGLSKSAAIRSCLNEYFLIREKKQRTEAWKKLIKNEGMTEALKELLENG